MLPAPGTVLPGGKRKAPAGEGAPDAKRQAAAAAAGDGYDKFDWQVRKQACMHACSACACAGLPRYELLGRSDRLMSA